MARYTCSFSVASSLDELKRLLSDTLQTCSFDIIYHTEDYMMAREVPGRVAFAQLVTVEVLIDKTKATHERVCMSLVAKNEELPLQVNNHCQQLFDQVRQAIAQNPQSQLLESQIG